MENNRCALWIDSSGTLPHKSFGLNSYTVHYPAPAAQSTYVQGTPITGASGQANWRCYKRTQNGIFILSSMTNFVSVELVNDRF